jgi:hypothetical protein
VVKAALAGIVVKVCQRPLAAFRVRVEIAGQHPTRLARAQLPLQQDHVAGAQQLRQPPCQGKGGLLAAQEKR